MTDTERRCEEVAARLLGNVRAPGESATAYLSRIVDKQLHLRVWASRDVLTDFEMELVGLSRFEPASSGFKILTIRGVPVYLDGTYPPGFAQGDESEIYR